MPRTAKLKVFRTPIGFHDAYVAAPSQKAAIEAWGSDRDVFGRGEAEVVTDPDLMAEPLSKPGVVVKRLRGSAEENLAALPPNKPRSKAKPRKQEEAPAAEAPPKPKPRPSRAALEKAEEALEAARKKHRAALDRLRKKEAALARERTELEEAQASDIEKLEAQREDAARDYREAMDEWRS